MKKRKKKKTMRAMTAVTAMLAITLLLVWGASMYALTIVTAQLLYDKLLDDSIGFVEYVSRAGRFSERYNEDSSFYRQNPEQFDYDMLHAIEVSTNYSTLNLRYMYMFDQDVQLMRPLSIPMETAVIFYDKDGNILFKNGNYVYFWYSTQEAWNAGEEGNPNTQHFGWIELGEEEGNDLYRLFLGQNENARNLRDYRYLRITGTIDGTQVKPLAMYAITDTQIFQLQERLESWHEPEYILQEDDTFDTYYNFLSSDLDRAGYLDWQPVFDHTADLNSQDGLMTIYAFTPELILYKEKPVAYMGEMFSLFELAGGDEFGLGRILYSDRRTFRDWSLDSGGEEAPADFIMRTTVLCYPMRAAISTLRNIYIVTFLLALALLLLVRRIIKKRLVVPLRAINNGIADNWSHVYTVDNRPAMWREADELYEHYLTQRDWQHYAKNELTRLTAALNYAKKSEQNRRQLTSSITHELKTPLAIIHSYSEGLKEHIAEEKREQYLDVILSEAEHMDSMVLEMLDLSRLESGKVKLSRDDFSLSELVRSIFDKLDTLAREKNLTVTLELDGDCKITADESRIGQVITNFASNAVRYTPEGGTIQVKTWSRGGETGFSVENTSKPFTSEELTKVWETFYQTDISRGGKGTGLGLAIAKSIIELHQGTCSARNTETGVEFGFAL